MNPHQEKWAGFLKDCRSLTAETNPFQISGRLTRINGLVMEAAGLKLPLGSGCHVSLPGGAAVEAEVVGFSGEKLFMMPTDDVYGLAPGAHVVPLESRQELPAVAERLQPNRRQSDRAKHLPVGDELLGRVQVNASYQQAVVAQENFDKLMMQVNNWIAEGIKSGAASPIITLS